MFDFEEGYFYLVKELIDFYYYYKEDFVLFVEMGFKIYCMLIVWMCIFLKGDELYLNEVGFWFYENIFKECCKYGIEFLVIIIYFDCFIYFIKYYGGWWSCKMIGFYECFVWVLFICFKGLVKYWLIFNEINMILYVFFMGVGLYFEDGEN